MTITLSPDPLAWIQARVSEGAYSDLDETVRDLLATGIAEHADFEDDLAWAKPSVDEALADIARGNFSVVDDTDAYIDGLFRSTEAGRLTSRCGRGRRRISSGSPAIWSSVPVGRSRTSIAFDSERLFGGSHPPRAPHPVRPWDKA